MSKPFIDISNLHLVERELISESQYKHYLESGLTVEEYVDKLFSVSNLIISFKHDLERQMIAIETGLAHIYISLELLETLNYKIPKYMEKITNDQK